MFCKYCGAELPENTQFCSVCGKPTTTDAVWQGPVDLPQNEPDEKLRDELASKALTYGILSVAFALYGVVVAFLGIIFGAKAKSYASKYAEEFGEVKGRAAVGRGLGIGGLIAGIVFTVFWVWYILFVIMIAVLSAETDPSWCLWFL